MNNSENQHQNANEQLTNLSVIEEKQKQKHMQLLHQYNDLKDATEIVLGALAQAKGLPVKEMYKIYNLPKHE
ncbi:DNA repair protein SWI5 homolog [Drosophila albomicans]|uniref:DNA repair protein SWI5 homolog n=1 Tax=Drosophila albomicans TaxID=7291 RepID=A0A6P8X5K7_DROAB|nr:DNA repair protein SWI5 homolog [Drosophila albomicans]